MSTLKVGTIINPADNISLDVTEIARSVIPAGTVIYLAGSTVPTGFLKCNGAELLRSVYSDLFTAIGIAYGAGDGSTSFLLPDLRGEFIRGWDDSRGVDVDRVLGSSQEDALQGHWHDIVQVGTNWQLHRDGGTVEDVESAGNADDTPFFISELAASLEARTPLSATGYGTVRLAAETRPRNIALMAVIKY